MSSAPPSVAAGVWRIVALAAALSTLALVISCPRAEARSQPSDPAGATLPSPGDPPVFAYYYIWFTPTSWNRAKTDYPLAGRYSSDEVSVMEAHVDEAQRAGIDGFIVSWKHTPALDRRLAALAEIAERKRFALWIIYQGLDFAREPLPVARVADDLRWFADTYAAHPAFNRHGPPVVIWSGSWRFSPADIAAAADPVRDRVRVLGSERDVDGIERLAGTIDGDAYYWSSVDPDTFPGYDEKLAAMGRAAQRNGGLWIAPVAPGFDARLVGGTRIVDREDGQTLRRQWSAATSSVPDALAIISWNEFSENSHIEPSRQYGARYLEIVHDLTGAPAPFVDDFSSDAPAGPGGVSGLLVLAGTLAFLVGTSVALWRRTRRDGSTPQPLSEGAHP